MLSQTKPVNIWESLPQEAEFVLPIDKAAKEYYNNKPNQKQKLETQHLPIPRMGSIDAPLYVLGANPKYISDDGDTNHNINNPSKLQAKINSIKDHTSDHIDIANRDRWWLSKLKYLINKDPTNEDIQRYAKKVCSIEFIAYPSAGSPDYSIRFPSQCYTRELILYGIENKKNFIVRMGFSYWLNLVPELLEYIQQCNGPNQQFFYIINNPQWNKNMSKGLKVPEVSGVETVGNSDNYIERIRELLE